MRATSDTTAVFLVDDDREVDFTDGLLDATDGGDPLTQYRAYNAEEAIEELQEFAAKCPGATAIAFVDIRLPWSKEDADEGNIDPEAGLKLMDELKTLFPDDRGVERVFLKLVAMTGKGWGRIQEADEDPVLARAKKLGIVNWLAKPIRHDEIKQVIRQALEPDGTLLPPPRTPDESFLTIHLDDRHVPLIGRSRVFQEDVVARIIEFAPARKPVLVLGENGTGKELVARAIHQESHRRGPFQAVNCAALPEALVENELFGHWPGAFAGAKPSGAPGRIELAHEGTLFLDEIAEMSPNVQAKLLRVVQDGKVERLGAGSKKAKKVDVRVVSATNQDLDTMIEERRFRRDLYHRLAGFVVRVPALRQRPEDIPDLAEHFLSVLNQHEGTEKAFANNACAHLRRGQWHGNVRELENAVSRAFRQTTSNTIRVEDLEVPATDVQLGLVKKALQTLADALLFEKSLTFESLKFDLIEEVLKRTAGNLTPAAKALGVSINTVAKHRRALADISKALIEADFDEDRAAEQLGDFKTAAFLEKRLRHMLRTKTRDDLTEIAGENSYPDVWVDYMARFVGQ